MRLFFLVCLSILSTYVLGNESPGNLKQELMSAQSDSSRMAIYTRLLNIYSSTNYDSAVFFADKALLLARSTKDQRAEHEMQNRLARIYHEHGDLPKAEKLAIAARKGFESIKDKDGLASTYLTLGTITGKRGHFPEATSHILKALKIYEEISGLKGIFDSYIKLGLINEQSGNLDQALSYYKKGQVLVDKEPALKGSLSLQNNIGVVYAKKGQMREALDYFLMGLQKADSLEHADLYMSLLTNAGNAYQHLGAPDTAYTYHTKSLKMSRDFESPEKEARALVNIAALYVGKKDFARAIELLDEAIKIAESIGHAFLLSEIYEAYIEIYEQQGSYKDAFRVSQKLRMLNDSLFSRDKKRAAELMQVEYEKEKSAAQIKTLETLSGRTTIQRNVGISIAVFVIIMLLVVYFSLHNVQKYNKKLKVSNQIKDKLFSIIGHDLRGPMGSVVQMLTLMENDVLKPDELKEIAQILKKHTEASLSTLDSLLEWGKTQIQGVRVKQKVFEVVPEIELTKAFFLAGSTSKNLTIVNKIPEGLKVYADPDHFNFVVRNLLSNAMKFSYPGGNIELKAEQLDGFTCFSVKDYGKGMEESAADHIFETFSVKGEGTNGEQGTGIGLMLCKEFVMANGGRIWVKTKAGEGAEFFFTVRSNAG